MRTACLYGLNYQVVDDYRKDKTELVRVKFPSFRRNYTRTRSIKYNYTNQLSGKEFLFKPSNNLIIVLPNTINFLRTGIASLNKPFLT